MAFNAEVLDRLDMKMYGTLLGQRIISTYSFFAFNGSGPVPFTEVVSDLEALFSAAGGLFPTYRAAAADNYVFNYAQWQLWKGVVKYAAAKVTHEQNGTWTDSALTPNIAGVAVRRGDRATRNNVSTLHIPISTAADAIEGGLIKPALKLAIQAHMAKLLITYSTVGGGHDLEWTACIPNGPNATQNTPITSTEVKSEVRVMRRRTVGYGI